MKQIVVYPVQDGTCFLAWVKSVIKSLSLYYFCLLFVWNNLQCLVFTLLLIKLHVLFIVYDINPILVAAAHIISLLCELWIMYMLHLCTWFPSLFYFFLLHLKIVFSWMDNFPVSFRYEEMAFFFLSAKHILNDTAATLTMSQ